MQRTSFYTLLSLIQRPPEDLLSRMSSTTRNEIRQVSKTGIQGKYGSTDEFTLFYNRFARLKALAVIDAAALKRYGDQILFTSAICQGRTMAMHALLLDSATGRVRLLRSANNRFSDPQQRKVTGRANRWLHWWEMQELADSGYSVYDWGGVAPSSNDPQLVGINRFKTSFGGRLVEEWDYRPVVRVPKWSKRNLTSAHTGGDLG